ncbi:uncharacterized protein LOC119556225 [Drosophila subpulchrella]|uniref:uncharacterized protein LOC119556225 n=1 Tax=Drosophila subpulchrella TaxID=1486046 RepID=UPI0018A19BD0|nr:uncharacterized protein LOC119556225 [Drosophila subpulchrella]
MPKFPTKRFNNEAARNSHTPNIARYTNSRALRSVYCQLPGAVGGQRAGGASEAGVATAPATTAQEQPTTPPPPPAPRVWNCNKPKVAKPANRTYNVYAKRQANSMGKERSKMSIRQWAHPPYPVHRSKEERNRQKERPRNFDAFFVPFEPLKSLSQSFFVPLDDNREMPQPRRQRTKEEILSAEAAVQEEPPSRSFQRLLPAGERYALKIAEMASLVAKAKCHQRILKASEEMEVDDGRLMLQRSRTETLFSTFDCDELLYKYACHLPYVRDPANPNGTRPRLPRYPSQLTI